MFITIIKHYYAKNRDYFVGLNDNDDITGTLQVFATIDKDMKQMMMNVFLYMQTLMDHSMHIQFPI